jgi:hypothetical protein
MNSNAPYNMNYDYTDGFNTDAPPARLVDATNEQKANDYAKGQQVIDDARAKLGECYGS